MKLKDNKKASGGTKFLSVILYVVAIIFLLFGIFFLYTWILNLFSIGSERNFIAIIMILFVNIIFFGIAWYLFKFGKKLWKRD